MPRSVELSLSVSATDASLVLSLIEAAFEDAISGVAVFDEGGTLRYLNPVLATLLATPDGRGLSLADLAPADRTGKPFIDFERFRAGRLQQARARFEIARVDSTRFWADVSARRRSFAPDIAPLVVIGVIDVSSEIEAASALIREVTRLETALEAGRQGIWEFDNPSQTLSVSPGWRRLRGINSDVPIPRDFWLSHVHPEDKERINRTSREQGEVDGFDTIEYRERRSDGRYFWVFSRGRPYRFDDKGKPLRVIGTDTDITPIKTIEAELALEKERLHVTLQSIADGVISIDAEGRVTFLNDAAERMTGWSVESAVGQPIEAVYDSRFEEKPSLPAGLVAQCLRNGRVHANEGYTLLKGKRSRYVNEIAAPLKTSKGEVIGAVLVFRDATQTRKLMRQLEYSAAHDALTGLCNRQTFETHLERSVREAKAGGSRSALCLIDLDHFKAVNDGAGHSAGDALLKRIARLIRGACRERDCVARLGGDEFALILDTCDVKTARSTAQSIASRIARLGFSWQGETFHVGASIGITAIDGSTDSPADFYRNADNACYAAKRNGRGCVVVCG